LNSGSRDFPGGARRHVGRPAQMVRSLPDRKNKEDQFRLLVESVVDYSILMLSPGGRVVSWNAGTERIKGYGEQDLIGKHFSCFYTCEDVALGKPAEQLRAALANGRFEEENWRTRKDGSVFWAHVAITAVRGQDGALLGYSEVTRDVTERKRHEAELLHAKATAERANAAKSEFLAKMSHELRTPLNSLLILARLLASNGNNNLTPKQVRYAQTIHASGQDLTALINDILDLAKIESGSVSVQISEDQFAEMREDIEHSFGQLAKEKGLAFSVSIDPSLPDSIETDVKRLRQILRNLLSNAFKFTQTGGVSLQIRPARDGWMSGHLPLDRADSVVAFSVSDTGIGIPADLSNLIFEPFQQADGSTSRTYGGTGLGLSISRELARLLGGEIFLKSTPGKGSIFTLYLPLQSRTVVHA
jgi:PAS domain S-box-containing protein